MQVSCLFQDNQGYLWSGGYGGLSAFDGIVFKNFSKKNGLIDNNVNALCENDSGFIFVGTNKGINLVKNNTIYKNNAFSNFNANITCLCNGLNSQLFIGTTKGLFVYDNNSISAVQKLNNLKINCIIKSNNQTLFVGTDEGLIIIENKSLKRIGLSNGLPSNQINNLEFFQDQLVIASSKGLSFLDLESNKITNYFVENGLIDENITVLAKQNNFLWVGSHSGLLKYDGKQFYYYNIGFDNNSNFVRSLTVDKENNLWIGTHSGLYKYRDNAFISFDKVNGPGNAFVFGVMRDSKDNLWLCSENNGIYKYTQGYFKRFGLGDGLISNVCRSIVQCKNDNVLFGFENGVMLCNNEKFNELKLPSNIVGPYDCMYTNDGETIFIGGNCCFCKIKLVNGKIIESETYELPKKQSYSVYGFTFDDTGKLWVGTYGNGLFYLKNKTVYSANKEFNLTEENFFSIKYHKGKLLSGSFNGLSVFDINTKALTYITEENGLNSDYVYSVEFTENKKNLWLGTNQGVNKFDIEKYVNSNFISVKPFGKQDGFLGIECNSNGIWEDKDGSVWFGTVSGIIKHEPFSIKTNTLIPVTQIQKFNLAGGDTLLANNCKLPYNMNSIAIHYRGICLTNPDKVKYLKKLEGLEKTWSNASSEDYSKYANLAPGKYTFRVKCCNNEELWSDNETTFTFTILPPFYLTWWFVTLLIFLIVFVVVLIFSIRVRGFKKKQKIEFDRKVEMSKIELKALRSQMNPHFIFNSLNSIQHYIFNSKTDEAIKYLNKFARLVRIILNNSDKPTVTVEEDLEALKLYLELEQMRFEGKFEYDIKVDNSVDVDYDIMPPLLMQPYVENAILHGLNPKPETGLLTIHLSCKNNLLICTITDNGIGRDKSSLIKHTMPGKKHKSLGMKITQDRLKILNEINGSDLNVNIIDLKDNNSNDCGTKVEIFVPLNF